MSANFQPHHEAFPTTGWSHVMLAGKDSHKARSALNELCQKYWRPIYAFARHRGNTPHDAEDLTQGYFADLLDRGYIEQADQTKGRFRAFLIHDFKLYMARVASKAGAKKRGGGLHFIPIDSTWAETRHETGSHQADSDQYYDRQWALDTVAHARERLAKDYADQGKHQLFSLLQTGLVTTPNAALYEHWQSQIGMSTGALKVALHRLRERFREALEHQVMQTLTSQDDLKPEMAHLLGALSKA